MSEKTMLVVTDVYELVKQGKGFDEDLKRAKKRFTGHLVERTYAEEMNHHVQRRGLKYVIDEQASIDAQEERELKAKQRLERDEARLLAAKAVTSIAMGVNQAKTEDDPVGSMAHSVKELRAMDSLTEMSDEELDEFFKAETRATGKAFLGELITGNNE